jgi:hypothetical protein
MSKISEKEAGDDAIFDKTAFADRRAQSVNQKSGPESDKLNLPRVAKSISGGGTKHSVDFDDYSSGSDSSASPGKSPPRTVAGFEDRRAAGYYKQAGKHVAADGLVSRLGYRRILPNSGPDMALFEQRAEEVARLAKQVLHGRNATVFEGRVLDPLMGRSKRSVEELAAQFGVTSAKIHKITEKAKERVAAAIRYKQSKSLAPEEPACPTCGRWYSRGWEPCRRGYGEGAEYSPFTHPECCPPSFRKVQPPRARSIPCYPKPATDLRDLRWWRDLRHLFGR